MPFPKFNFRRFRRISLRKFLLVVALLGAILGYAAKVKHRAVVRERMAAAIQKDGGYVTYDYQMSLDWQPGEQPTPPGWKILRRLLGEHAFARVVAVGLTGKMNEHLPDVLPEIESVEFRNVSADSRALRPIPRLRKVRALSFVNSPVSSDAISLLRDLPVLEEVLFSGVTLDDDSALALSRLPHITHVTIQYTALIGQPLDRLRHLVSLRALHLKELKQTTPIALSFVGDLKNLESFDFVYWDVQQTPNPTPKNINEQSLSGISNADQLRSVFLSHTNAGDVAATFIASLPNLEQLSLQGTKITSEALRGLSGCGQLKRLYVGETAIDDEALVYASRMVKLDELDIRMTDVTDRGLEAIGQSESLRIIHVSIDRSVSKRTPNCRLTGRVA